MLLPDLCLSTAWSGYAAIAVKAMFFAYLVVIVLGCGACIVIGLVQS